MLLNPTQPHLHHTYLRNFNNEFYESLTKCFLKEVLISLLLSSPLAAQAGFRNSNDSAHLWGHLCSASGLLQASSPKVGLPQPGHKGRILSMGGARKPSSSGKLALASSVEVLLGPMLLRLPFPSASCGTEDTMSRQPAPFCLGEQPSESPLPFPPQPLCLPAVLLALLHSQAVTGTIRPEKDCAAYCGDTERRRKCKEQQAGEVLTSPVQPLTAAGSLLPGPKRPGTGASHLS